MCSKRGQQPAKNGHFYRLAISSLKWQASILLPPICSHHCLLYSTTNTIEKYERTQQGYARDHPKSLPKLSTMIALSDRMEIGRWSEGRPVFKKDGDSPRFLRTQWEISSSTKETSAWVKSGKATNSPTSAKAGASARRGVTRWRYFDLGWKEGDISVSCV